MPDTPFVYYPLHVPADMALTLRSPEYLDQVATIDFLLRTIPDSHVLVAKEHLQRHDDDEQIERHADNHPRLFGRAAARAQ